MRCYMHCNALSRRAAQRRTVTHRDACTGSGVKEPLITLNLANVIGMQSDTRDM